MSRKTNGISKGGFERIAQAAERQAMKTAERQAALEEPKLLKFASKEDLEKQFDARTDGKLVHKVSHRIWELKSSPSGFEVIRAQDESVDHEPAQEPEEEGIGGDLSMSARLTKAAARGAQFMPPESGMPQNVEMGECAQCGMEGLVGQDLQAGPDGMLICNQCGGMEQESQSMPDAPPPAPAAPMPANTMMASLKDILETPAEKKTAGLKRGTQVLVKVGHNLMAAKIVNRTATYFDVLLSNGATSRVPHALVSVPKRAQVGQFILRWTNPSLFEDGKPFSSEEEAFSYARQNVPQVDHPGSAGVYVNDELVATWSPETGETTRFDNWEQEAQSQEPLPPPGAPSAVPTMSPVAKKVAVDQKAKDYWGKYWEEYGRQLVNTDLPRAVTDHAEPATPKSKQKTPTKVAALDYVDIGNLWMAEGSALRTGVVQIVSSSQDGKRLLVKDPFEARMDVPRAAVLFSRTAEDFARIKAKGTKANKSAMLQAASAALTWEQLSTRYPDAAGRLPETKAAIARGIRVGLAGGDVLAKGAGLLGRAAARAEFTAGMNKTALDEKGKEYYKAYWGSYGDDLVKEIKRRVKADIILRAATPVEKPQTTPKVSNNQKAASALEAHVCGVTKSAGKTGTYKVLEASVEKTSRSEGKVTLSGTFRGSYTEGNREVTSKQAFEMLVEGGKVRGIRIR